MSKPYSKTYKGEVQAKASSNIALIKYWGKYDTQIPANPSLSYTLTNSYTETEIQYESVGYFDLEFWFEGEKNEVFANRVRRYLESIKTYVPFIAQLKLKIQSRNTFPHSSGIASSASAFAALALALMEMESEIAHTHTHTHTHTHDRFKSVLSVECKDVTPLGFNTFLIPQNIRKKNTNHQHHAAGDR